jgi:hypothetical protein
MLTSAALAAANDGARVADPRVLRPIRLWLEAGILESDEWHETEQETPQRGASALLANIFLITSSIFGCTDGVADIRADRSLSYVMPTTS